MPTSFALDLADLDGTNGFVINQLATYGDSQPFRQTVGTAGDVNGDGIDDLVVGAPLADPGGRINAGESYVVFGSSAGFPANLEPSILDGSNGFVIEGILAGDNSGWSARSAGDLNADGTDDLIIGSYIWDPYLPINGQAYVVFGTRDGFSATLELSSLDGSNGFIIDGVDRGDLCGHSVSGAGDVNADGIDDVLIGAFPAEPHGIDRAGETYVLFGSTAGFNPTFSPAALDGSNGFTINGINAVDRSGAQVEQAGDVNDDGIVDVLIAAPWGDSNGVLDAGEAYVVFGSALGFSASLELSSLDGSNGFVLNGIDVGDNASLSLAGAGDVNGDGIDDVVIGAQRADPDGRESAGEAYVVFGTNAGFGASLDLSALDGSNGFKITGIEAGDNAAHAVNRAGDVNADGFDDLIIGAPGVDIDDQPDTGAAYVLFGTDTGFPLTVHLSALDPGIGLTFLGLDAYEQLGISVSTAGDLNGGGVDDLVIGTLGAEPETGKAYIVFGESLTICDPPVEPASLKARITRSFVLLRWSASEDADRYNVYRRVDGEGSFELIGSTGGTSYRDSDYAMGDEFDLLEYYVTAETDCAESEPSAVVTVRPKGPK